MRVKNEAGIIVLKVALDGRRTIWRRIAMRRAQTLHDLAHTINRAFDRDDDHLYAFYIGPNSGKFSRQSFVRAARRYPHPTAIDPFLAREAVERNAEATTLASLRLSDGQAFYYLFDFGDEWWHFVTVEQAEADEDPAQSYPAVLAQHGKSPEQYPEDESEQE